MSYDPAPGAEPGSPWNTAYLSQRDLSLQVPINYVTWPTVSLTSACFPNNVYEDAAAQTCFSNLLAAHFRRYEIDLYWDTSRKLWSLCPVQIPGPKTGTNVTSTLYTNSSTNVSLTPGIFVSGNSKRQFSGLATSVILTSSTVRPSGSKTTIDIAAPTASTTSNTADASNITNAISQTATSQTLPTITETPSNSTLLSLGPYQCTPSVNISLITNVLLSYIGSTDNTIQARLDHFILNLHVGASIDAPAEPAAQPVTSDLPSEGNFLSTILVANLSSYLYTPAQLQSERSNLNNSWNNVPVGSSPETWFYTEAPNENGILVSPNGWPTEDYAIFVRRTRLLVGLGRIDPQLSQYDASSDSQIIFGQGELQSFRPIQLDTTGAVTQGCFLVPGVFSISQINSSWAYSDDINGLTITYANATYPDITSNSIHNIAACGISPSLNQSIQGVAANEDFRPYQDFAYNNIWSWALGQPENSTNLSPNDRCAVIDSSLSGRWRVAECTSSYYAACRNVSNPYEWLISNQTTAYFSADESVCPPGSTFDVPRTALQNSYLNYSVQMKLHGLYSTPSTSTDQLSIWVNFNDVDVEGCWVPGLNGTCPYQVETNTYRRTVVIPIVAAIIIGVVACFFVFVKYASYRKDKGKRRKRKHRGWNYEGIPG